MPALSDAASAAAAAASTPRLRIVVMGVSGCGKTTIGRALAQALGLPHVEGDELHPPRNVALMAAGTPLNDHDRQAWLEAVAAALVRGAGDGAVISCSALKRRYRNLLRASAPDLRLLYLHGEPGLLAERMRGRAGHYMPETLLPSQLATLEPPAPDEQAITIDIRQPLADAVAAACRALRVAQWDCPPCI